MIVSDAIGEILKAEGTEYLFTYPVNPITEGAAKAGIRPIVVRQERIGLHMADAFSRMNSGEKIGVFCMQHGPGSENAFGGVAQAYGDSAPIVVLPAGYSRDKTNVDPNFSSLINYRNVTKSCEQVTMPSAVPAALRRAFMQAKNGRPRPALVEIPQDIFSAELNGDLNYRPVPKLRRAPDPNEIPRIAKVLIEAERPVIYAGQGTHYAKAWEELKELAELLEAPVTTSLQGKSAFPENHPLSLGSGGLAIPKTVHDFLQSSDVIFGIGCSFTNTGFGVAMPTGKTIIHATLDELDINKDVEADYALVGDARLTLRALIDEIGDRLGSEPRGRSSRLAQEISRIRAGWLADWKPKLRSDEVPLCPYRVIWDLLHTVDVENTIITHDAGSPRDQLSPFWQATAPLSYIGWGKTTQLGYGLGLAMGAKLARPDKLCINVWGDAAIGFTGMDFETAARAEIPILSILFNNFCMAIELRPMALSTEKFRSTDISGNYADMAKAFGGYGERIETLDEIVPAIKRGIEQTEAGKPALLEFITCKETEISRF